MSLYKNKFRIESNRLKEWDYSNPWWYYISINTKNHVNWFGEIKNDKVVLNEIGLIVKENLNSIHKHFDMVELDSFIIMPNHIHAIVIINEIENKIKCSGRDGIYPVSTKKAISLSTIIGTFKASVTRWCNNNDIKEFSWQERFYDRIIRNDKELERIRKYIQLNPIRWVIKNL
ncbi:MAG: transposase [Ignavibacteriales bacterium]|nr:MAG: transposase [Ignavibacteriales bacterium]